MGTWAGYQVKQSMDYVSQPAVHKSHHSGDVLTVVGLVGLSHWWTNKKRKAMGLEPEPMNKYVGWGMGFGIGWIFWWVPFAVYIALDYALFHIHILAFLATVGVFIGAWKLYRHRYAKKYSKYYETKAVQLKVEPEPHAPASDEWLAQAGERMRKNVGLQ
jgi:hypothetical protein